MIAKAEGTVTRLLDLVRAGDSVARDDLLEAVYDELRQVAAGLMRGERPDHTLQPTALLNEAILRLLKADGLAKLENRPHFFAAVARAMREILIEHARRRGTARRGGDCERVPLDEVLDDFHSQNLDVAALHEALEELGKLDDRQRQVVELRFFWGFTVDEVARELQLSATTIESEFRNARAFLRSRLGR